MASSTHCPFCGILNGAEPGKIIVRDEKNKFALIQSIHPGSVVHWLAVPYEHVESTEEMEHNDRERFLGLVDFAITQARIAAAKEPDLMRGFTLKMHFGSFETVPHAKLHVVAVE
jgi:histidine triad (HIT) family protein